MIHWPDHFDPHVFTLLAMTPMTHAAGDEQDERRWAFDRTINLPFLFTMVGAVIAGAVWWQGINSQIGEIHEDIRSLRETAEQANRNAVTLNRLEVKVENVEEEVRLLRQSGKQ